MNSIASIAATISTVPADLDAALTELEALNLDTIDTAYDRKLMARAAMRDRQSQHRKAQNLRESIAYDIAGMRLANRLA